MVACRGWRTAGQRRGARAVTAPSSDVSGRRVSSVTGVEGPGWRRCGGGGVAVRAAVQKRKTQKRKQFRNLPIFIGATSTLPPYIRWWGHITNEYKRHIFIGDVASSTNYKGLVKVNPSTLYVSWCQVQTNEYNIYSSVSVTDKFISPDQCSPGSVCCIYTLSSLVNLGNVLYFCFHGLFRY
jgi:hypothetical protein